ncbi:fumarylacetoacetate hydrolase family protein [Fervidicoccus fontis]|uniref:5-carboxymethyl-2-hydroxymuconate Delta-isomerase n=2 Tax=Fervidicoccus fontis TaxID=683846 RepID=I0A2A4_FERFK|nr:fumarylacetoacetate hydrolase family protein [Fervidicoccus fontis]AFH43111.1 5-carboxymethyl-2-hydroxymuconate Delta-isomerase [Fervidicoccus fontis Kam940]MBE9390491.1 fumarylacetoacetate hydrolase family protein [Fervidicoccus fontis]PMB75880.1 MAG: fumarylacetoacetate hydrolase family protein [Fervidicoccus fontis]PMB77759.1 MAG: fumarylacetoacetate hydrolase family protein [Fervidicoccus fontis]HEW64132.1 FAA hydrolase family protein [Fervidicoccus fontis]
MKLLTFSIKGEKKVGLLTEKGVLDLPQAFKKVYKSNYAPDFFYSMKKLILMEKEAKKLIEEIEAKSLDLDLEGNIYLKKGEFKWEPPVLDSEKFLCVAVNYKQHGQESGLKPPSRPYFFPKFPTSLVGHEDNILKPKVSEKVDWEVELGVVIGKAGKYIKKDDADEHIFGYTIVNDITMRDWQFPPLGSLGLDWIGGKTMDLSTPVGPYIVTKDEIDNPNNLKLYLRVNGSIEQNGSTNDLIFNVEELIEWSSKGITLRPGDIISTGTPSGVGHSKNKYLKGGDEVEAEVEKIGILRNFVVEEL